METGSEGRRRRSFTREYKAEVVERVVFRGAALVFPQFAFAQLEERALAVLRRDIGDTADRR